MVAPNAISIFKPTFMAMTSTGDVYFSEEGNNRESRANRSERSFSSPAFCTPRSGLLTPA